jgi:PAS domain S-box-containing protein
MKRIPAIDGYVGLATRLCLLLAPLAALVVVGRHAAGPSALGWAIIGYAAALTGTGLARFATRTATQRQIERDRIFALSHDLLCTAGMNGYFKQVNPAFIEQTGFSQAELLGTPFVSFVHPDDYLMVKEDVAQLALGQQIEGLECRCRFRDGSYHWLSWSAVAVVNEGLVLAVARDITARKEAELRLGYLSAIVESSRDAIFGSDCDGRITFWNPSAERLYGYTAEEAIGRDSSLTAPPEKQEEQRELRRMSMACEAVEDFDTVRRRKDGSLVPVSLTLSPIRNASGEIVGVSSIVRDVTDRKLAEEALRASNAALIVSIKRAEEANSAKSEFLANMSHEIRTPMTSILGFAELLADENWSRDSAKRHDALDSIQRNGRHLLEIIDDILDLSKVEAGQLFVERLPCATRGILKEVDELMRARAEAKGLSLEIDCADSVPALIETDAVRLRQILINLLGNAIKFTDTGAIRLRVLFEDAAGGPRVCFEVSDTGIGISDEQLAKLFHPFSQADASITRRYGGTGLGLTISKRLTELLGGEIMLASQPGRGSVVRVALPAGAVLQAEAAGAAVVEPAAEPLAESPQPAAGLSLEGRILLAEDGPDNQRLIAYILRRAGAEVEIAENGGEAIECVRAALRAERPWDLILMDMQMPVLDGYSAARRLRQEGCQTPIVALTAHSMSGDRERCMEAGCNDYVTKPIDRARLIQTLARHMKHGADQQQLDKA